MGNDYSNFASKNHERALARMCASGYAHAVHVAYCIRTFIVRLLAYAHVLS